MVTYLLCELFNNGAFVVNFVLVACLQAVDFWYTKARARGRLRTLPAHHGPPERERPQAGGPALLEHDDGGWRERVEVRVPG